MSSILFSSIFFAIAVVKDLYNLNILLSALYNLIKLLSIPVNSTFGGFKNQYVNKKRNVGY
jgi:hypothetical protein